MWTELLSFLFAMVFIQLFGSFPYTCGRQRITRGRIVLMRALQTFSDEKDRISQNRPYEKATKLPIRMPSVILVEPFLDRNVGTVSRCMLNYGLSDLRLVNPQCDHLSEDARALAVGSYEVLENAKVYSSLEECIADLNYVFATTGRRRSLEQEIFNPEQAAQKALDMTGTTFSSSSAPSISVGIMFGREKNGLTKDEMICANSIITIGSFEAFPVLNLGQSVNIVCYELFQKFHKAMQHMETCQINEDHNVGQDEVKKGDLTSVISRLENMLEKSSYFNHQLKRHNNKIDPASLPKKEQRDIVFRGLRGIFHRTTGLTQKETSMLHGMIAAVEELIDAHGEATYK